MGLLSYLLGFQRASMEGVQTTMAIWQAGTFDEVAADDGQSRGGLSTCSL